MAPLSLGNRGHIFLALDIVPLLLEGRYSLSFGG